MTLNHHFDLSSLDPNKVTATIIVGPGVEYDDCDVIQFSNIWVNSQENNHARAFSKDPNQVQNLMTGFSNGCQYDKKPPIVRYNPREIDGVIYEYELIAGHHRFEAMTRLGYDRWIFWIYKMCLDGYSWDDCKITLQFLENNHCSELSTAVDDAAGGIIWMISHGSRLVENNEESIRNYVDTTFTNMQKASRSKVIKKVMAKLNTYRRIVTFTANDAFAWIEKNTDYKKCGEYDTKRKEYGWAVLEGYEYEHIFNAICKYAETGKSSYFVCRTNAPTNKRDLNTRRKAILDEIKYREDCLLDVFKYYQVNGNFPWRTEAFIPQDSELEDKNRPILVN